MSSGQLYDTIGTTYTVTRRTDPRIAEHLIAGRPVERLRIVPDGPWSATSLT